MVTMARPNLRRFCVAVLSALLFAAFTRCSDAKTPPETTSAAAALTIAWLSDTHIVTTDTLTTRGLPTVRLKRALDAIAARRDIDFIVVSGDLTEGHSPGQIAAFKEIMRPRLAWYPIPGNHDIGNTATLAMVDRWLADGFGRGDANREYYGFRAGDAAMFAINAFPPDPADSAMVQRMDEQLKAMDEFFAANSGAPVKLVWAHPPLFIKQADEPDEYFNVHQPLRRRLADIMKRHGVRNWMSGHRHLMDEVTDAASGITVYSQPALAFAIGKGSHTGFCIFRVTRAGIEREFIPIEP